MGRFKDEGNILVSNQSSNVLVNYNFMLRVEGIYDLPCKSVHSFTKENEFEYVQEGGVNDYVHMLRKPASKPFSFTVERYVGMDIVPPLPLGAELILPVILMVAPNANQFDKAKRTFVFTGCTVMSKTYGELNAEKSDLLTETIVIGYREMTEVTIPVHIGSDGKLWQFDGNKVEGNGKRSANTKGTETGSPTVRRYLVKKDQAGTSVKSAQTYADIYGEEMKRADPNTLVARKWPEKSSAKDGGLKNTAPKVRQYLIKKGQEGNSVRSAQTYADIYGEEMKKANPDTLVARKWPEKSSAKDYTDFGKKEPEAAKVRKWPPTQSAKQRTEGEKAKVRKWPPTQSAKKRFEAESKKEK